MKQKPVVPENTAPRLRLIEGDTEADLTLVPHTHEAAYLHKILVKLGEMQVELCRIGALLETKPAEAKPKPAIKKKGEPK